MKINGWGVFGSLVLGLGIFGVYNAVVAFNQPVVEARDVTTRGVITRIHGTELRHRLTNIKMNSQFDFDYKFTAEDGEEYSGRTMINETLFNQLKEGQEITVRYHSNYPSINASLPFGHYTPVGQIAKATPQARLFGCLGVCVFGGLIVFLAFRKEPETQKTQPVIDTRFQTAYRATVQPLNAMFDSKHTLNQDHASDRR